MRKSNRRQFLKQTGAGVAGVAALSGGDLALASMLAAVRPDMPAHRAVLLDAVHAYPDQQSVAAGQSLSLHVSSNVPYRLSICRLGAAVDDPTQDEILHEFPAVAPRSQPIYPGSYVHVSKGLDGPITQLTLECWVRPWKTSDSAGLIGQYDLQRDGGYGLLIAPGGALAFYLDDRKASRASGLQSTGPGLIQTGRWYHVIGTWDGKEKALWINGAKVAGWKYEGPALAGEAPLRLAAHGEDGEAARFLEGDLAMPVIYQRCLSAEEIALRFRQAGLKRPEAKQLFAFWELAEERGHRVVDGSGHGRHGTIINEATWMIGGPSFDPNVARFGSYDPALDPKRGHGLRFASDDLYDCHWAATHRYRLPATAKPGFYVGRIAYTFRDQPCLYHVAFVVRKSSRRKKSPILLLAATNTWRAYNAAPFAQTLPGLKQVCGTDGMPNSLGDPPAFSYYRRHAAGQGTYKVGLRVPWPAAGPYVRYGGATDYSHLMRADRFAQVWLERSGYAYDVVTDVDLHRDPELLRNYQVFIINGHSEYWSISMYRGLESYLRGGGNLICLSGNSLFWRVSFNEGETVMECRKVDAPGDQMPPSNRGECWHSQDGLRGGLLRDCGWPGWRLVGLETLGWNNQNNPAQFGPYIVDQPDHFLFKHPEDLRLKKGDPIGQAPSGGLPRANGHEIDVRLSTLASLQQEPAPAGASIPVDPEGIERLANGIITWKIGGAAFDYFFRPIKPPTDQGGELIYWDRLEGGRVFNAGSIGAGWALVADPKFQGLLRNVLSHFGVTQSG